MLHESEDFSLPCSFGVCWTLQPLLPIYFDRLSGRKLGGSRLTVSAMSDSYYEYLLKLWLFKDKRVRGRLTHTPCRCRRCSANYV